MRGRRQSGWVEAQSSCPELPDRVGNLEIYACFLIGFSCCNQVELVDRDVAPILVLNIQGGPGQNVVMNMLRRTAVFENECDWRLARRGGGGIRLGCGRLRG